MAQGICRFAVGSDFAELSALKVSYPDTGQCLLLAQFRRWLASAVKADQPWFGPNSTKLERQSWWTCEVGLEPYRLFSWRWLLSEGAS